jgi:hypothetical protein
MAESLKQSVLRELQQIPGVGKKIAEDLWTLGIRSVHDLKDNDPEALYRTNHKDAQIDRCMLYVFRCAVYYASTKSHDPELLKWWNWKDKR